jgi:hypothetical protein
MEKIKKCIRCGEDKVLSAYYKHLQMADGHLNKCAKCCKEQSMERHKKLSQTSEFVLSERERTRERYHRLNYKGKNKPTAEDRKKTIQSYFSRYPEKKKARALSSNLKCVDGFQNHHWSYNEKDAKDVIQLPLNEHARLHCYIIYDQERMMYRCAISIGNFIQNQLLDTKQNHLEYYYLIKSQFMNL